MLSRPWVSLLLLISLGFMAYSFMLGGPFKVLDDEFSIVHNTAIQKSPNIAAVFSKGFFNDQIYYRPLVNLSFMAEYHLFGLNSFFYNLDNLILHILNAFLVWRLASLILGSSSWGLLTAFVFLLHPINAEAVNNISGRAILLGTSFTLTAFIFFIRFDQYPRKVWLFISMFFFVLGLLCKESAAVLPGVIFLNLWFNQRGLSKTFPYIGILILYLCLRSILGLTHPFLWENVSQIILAFGTFLRSLLTDLRLLVLPIDLYFDRSQRLFLSFQDSQLWLTIVAWGVMLGILWAKRRRISPMHWFLIGWFALEMLPVSQIIHAIGVAPGIISSANHFLYLAAIPLFILAISVLKNFWELNSKRKWMSPRIVQGVIGGFLLVLCCITIEQNIYAANEVAMLRRSAEYEPMNARAQSSLGLLYARGGQFAQAQECFTWAVMASPHNPRYRISLAKSICDQGRYEECLKIYNTIDNPGNFATLLEANKEAAQRLLNQNHVHILSK